MGFNYAKEKKKFDLEWEILQKEYADAGMDPSAIEAMHSYDWGMFLSRRTYENHTQDEKDFQGRYAWIDTIEDAGLLKKLSRLSKQDLELLTLYAIEGCTQTEIALLLHLNQSVISRKINRIKKFFKK